MSQIGTDKREFTVVLRGPSSLIFPEQEEPGLLIKTFPSSIGPVDIGFATRYIKYGNDVTVQGQLWVEVRGEASNLDECLSPFANAALSILPILAVSGNGAVAFLNIEIAFDSSPDRRERDYFQCYIPPESQMLRDARLTNVNATISLLDATFKAPDSERLRRAMVQYQLALDYWCMGHEGLSTSHLWMALEALTKARIRSECVKRQLNSDEQLAQVLGVPINMLDATVRKDLLLNGDNECYTSAKKASDGFEHGFLGFDQIHKHALAIRENLAKYVRTAIFDLASLDGNSKSILISAPFDTPMGSWPLVQYLRGQLIGEGTQLAAAGNAYPFVKWKTSIKSSEPSPDGTRAVQPEFSFTPELGEGISFRPISYEMWRPH